MKIFNIDYRVIRFLFSSITLFTVLFIRHPKSGITEHILTAILSGIISEILLRITLDRIINR